MSNTLYHKEITDAQWLRIKSLFPESKKVERPQWNSRTAINGIIWIMKSGGRWRDLPARYSNWNSIYHKFRQWYTSGLFEQLLKLINSDTDNIISLELDSTFCKVHQSTFSSMKKQAIGVSRGGKNTKVHVLINTVGSVKWIV